MTRKSIPLVVVLVAAAGLLVYFWRQPKAATSVQGSATINVVAGENFWGDIVKQIGGSYVKVTSMITDPNADPHLYESNAANASAIATADVVIKNGLGYDDFMDRLLSVSPSAKRTVLSVGDMLQVSDHGANPHLWYDIPKVPTVAATIESVLAVKDPAHALVYSTNLATFDASLQPILNVMTKIKSDYPEAPVAYTERVPGYLLADTGLTVKTPVGFASAIEDGNDPSPSDTLAFQNLITSHSIKVLLYNAQAISAVTQHVRDLASQNNIPVVGVTETLPANEPHYQSWQLDQVTALLSALSR